MQPIDLKNQSGVALLIGLILLFVISILVVASSRNTIMQERMTSNARERNEAFQLAEDILRQVEEDIRSSTVQGTVPSTTSIDWDDPPYDRADCMGAAILAGEDPTTWDDAVNVVSGTTMKYKTLKMSGSVTCRPDEGICPTIAPTSSYYLIFAYAEGPQGKASEVLTSTYYFDRPCPS